MMDVSTPSQTFNPVPSPRIEPVIPSTKGHRPWKQPRRRPASSQRRVASLKIPLELKKKRQEERAALVRMMKAAKEADATAKEAERKRIAEKRLRKEENAIKSSQALVITNPKKLARMSKKQYQNYMRTLKIKGQK